MVRPLTAVILRPMRHCARPPPSIQMRTTSGGRSPACASGWGRGTPTSGSTVVGVAWQEAPFLAGGTISAVSTAWRVARRHRSASARRRRAAHKSWHRSTCTCGTIDHRPVARPGSQGRAGHLGGSAGAGAPRSERARAVLHAHRIDRSPSSMVHHVHGTSCPCSFQLQLYDIANKTEKPLNLKSEIEL